MKTKEQLIQLYLENRKSIEAIKEKQSDIIGQLRVLAPHKEGEIITWVETDRRRNIGSIWHPVYKELPDVTHAAVCVGVTPRFSTIDDSFSYGYSFCPIKKDGHLSVNHAYPPSDYTWTGEYFKNPTN